MKIKIKYQCLFDGLIFISYSSLLYRPFHNSFKFFFLKIKKNTKNVLKQMNCKIFFFYFARVSKKNLDIFRDIYLKYLHFSKYFSLKPIFFLSFKIFHFRFFLFLRNIHTYTYKKNIASNS